MLRPCHPGHASFVSDFLLAHEEHWTALTDRLYYKNRLRPAHKLKDLYVLEGREGLRGLVYHEPAGFTFPAIIKPLGPGDGASLGETLRSFNKITTLMGNSWVIDLCIRALGKDPAYRVDYLHMIRPRGATCFSPENPVPRETYERLKPGQVREIYPLQRAYEIEEVLLDPTKFNPLICMNHLREALKRQQIYGTRINGMLAAKAGTNALGVNWVQLGGIFTLPGFRGRGVGRRVMARLLENLDEQGLGSTLFVKPENIPAVSLYRRVGFSETGPFSIAYYLR